MAWWRRDVSLWSPLRTYQCLHRARADNQVLLRTRNFSASTYQAAQHREDEDAKRPPGISSQEWTRLQHYRRWKHRILADPYCALFGASNARLDGRGLRDWVHSSLPRWIIEDIDYSDAEKQARRQGAKSEETNRSKATYPPPNSSYPTKIDLDQEDQAKRRARELRFERDATAAGVVSPSDSRRPPKHDIMENIAKPNVQQAKEESGSQRCFKGKDSKPLRYPSVRDDVLRAEALLNEDVRPRQEKAAARKANIVHEFLEAPDLDTPPRSIDWRQTALDRRSATVSARITPTAAPTGQVSTRSGCTSSQPIQGSATREVTPDNSSSGSSNSIKLERPEKAGSSTELSEGMAKHKQQKQLGQSDVTTNSHGTTGTAASTLPPHRAEVLRQLPEHDIDFLTAEDIRSSMGRKRATQQNPAAKDKASLEKDFKAAQERLPDIAPFLRAKAINDQHIRRIKRNLATESNVRKEMAKSRRLKMGAHETHGKSGLETPARGDLLALKDSGSESVLGSSLNRMAREPALKDSADEPRPISDGSLTTLHVMDEGVTDASNTQQSDLPAATPKETINESSNVESNEGLPSVSTTDDKGAIDGAPAEPPASSTVAQDEDSSLPVESSELKKAAISEVPPPDATIPPQSPEIEFSALDDQPPKVGVSPEATSDPECPPPDYKTYKILSYNPSTEQMHMTTTSSKITATTPPAIPIHEALAGLDQPAKFLPHITNGFEIVTSKPNLLVLRESSDSNASKILTSEPLTNEAEDKEEEWERMRINPIDGTTRLSPTGFSGMDPQLRYDDHDASEKRKYYDTWREENAERERRAKPGKPKCKKGYSSAGVVKTAIVAGATCYVAGVVGELLQ